VREVSVSGLSVTWQSITWSAGNHGSKPAGVPLSIRGNYSVPRTNRPLNSPKTRPLCACDRFGYCCVVAATTARIEGLIVMTATRRTVIYRTMNGK